MKDGKEQPKEAASYCKKGRDFIEVGEMRESILSATRKGKRTDLEVMRAAVRPKSSSFRFIIAHITSLIDTLIIII